MSLTIPSSTIQPAISRPAVTAQPQTQDAAPTVQPQAVAAQAAADNPITDQAQITNGLQGSPSGGDAQTVANDPGQVSFVDGPAPGNPITQAGTKMDRVPPGGIAMTTYDARGVTSNNPLETFSFQRTFSCIAAALACTVVGAPSRSIAPALEPLRKSFAFDPNVDASDALVRSQRRSQAQAPQQPGATNPDERPVASPATPATTTPPPPVNRLRRSVQTTD